MVCLYQSRDWLRRSFWKWPRAYMHSVLSGTLNRTVLILYGHSYYRRRIGNRIQAFEWHQLQWHWVTSNPDFKVTKVKNSTSTRKWHQIELYLQWRKLHPSFRMALVLLTLSDLWSMFQGHDNIQRLITRLIVSRVWSTQWFRFQWPWVTVNLDFKVTGLS